MDLVIFQLCSIINMVFRAIHHDVKIAAVQLSEWQLLHLNDILLCCGFSQSTFFRILKLWQETGDVIKEQAVYGCYRTLHQTNIHYLLQLIHQNPNYFLDELLCKLKTNHFISVHYMTIHDGLICAGISQKRLQCITLEWNKALHADFIAHMAQFSPEELGFIGEVSKDEHTVGRCYGRSKRGTRACKPQPFVHGQCTSTVGVLSVNGFVAGTSVEGSLTKASFLHWMEFTVVSFFFLSLTQS